MNYLNLSIIITPLFYGLILLFFTAQARAARKKLSLKESIYVLSNSPDRWFISWFIIVFGELLILLPGELAPDFARYLSLGFIPLIVLSVRFLTISKISLRTIFATGIVSTIAGYAVFLFNTKQSSFWYYLSASGPIIPIHQRILILFFGSSFALFCIVFTYVLTQKNNRFLIYSLTAFLLCTLTFNAFLIFTTLFNTTHQFIIQDFEAYAKNKEITLPIYVWNEDIPFYLRLPQGGSAPNVRYLLPEFREYAQRTGFSNNGYYDLDQDPEKVKSLIEKNGGTVLILNYPYKYVLEKNLPHQEILAIITQLCTLEKQFMYNDKPTGQIFVCSALRNNTSLSLI